MNILAFDTCLDACSAAVFSDGGEGVRACAFEPMATGQAERLIPMISEVVGTAGLTFEDVDRIAVTVGPGTFTGTRIAIAAARALALAMNVPVVTATSLAVVAQQVARHLNNMPDVAAIAVAADARRGQVYWQRFSRGGGLAALCEPQVLTPEEAASQATEGIYALAGSAADAVARHAPAKYRVFASIELPRAEDLAAMAPHILPAGSPNPLYLRPADAKPQVGKSIARVAI
ncbi:Peptidase M22 [Candidatus Filomicrobium marinum]|uniref:Peptidase M22 n=1 Tax=Candidatus Filomicrobium marinum TaxID=1608628 RepID=A0A0D6JFL9_9HYPH|nr:tRNA (adenosine(37)-N6)-threonylcarbamoyltransferase complex dimerization subunit type 1 TsaB [Candidatus Filomicrobium marinum]CFX27367.1 Peptidase M22 [Candidatus Filomicrobium marinum]CPR19546.1 Peptidase M22 [Candidatus Filomicrobium marinum]